MYKFTTVLGSHLYNRLPRIYRFTDSTTDYTLARFLDALGEGLDHTYNSTEDLMKLLDVEKMDVRFLPLYAQMFGVTYENDVPEEFQRKFLSNLVDIYKRKGTKEVIEFVAREITGMKAVVKEGHHCMFRTWGTDPHLEMVGDYSTPRTFDPNQEHYYYLGGTDKTSRFTAYVTLVTEQDEEDVDIKEELIRRFVKGLIPSYTTLVFKTKGKNIDEELSVVQIAESHESFKLVDEYIIKVKANEHSRDKVKETREDYKVIVNPQGEELTRINISLVKEIISTRLSEHLLPINFTYIYLENIKSKILEGVVNTIVKETLSTNRTITVTSPMDKDILKDEETNLANITDSVLEEYTTIVDSAIIKTVGEYTDNVIKESTKSNILYTHTDNIITKEV